MLLLQAALALTLTAAQAKDHIGERAKVCGKITRTYFAEKTRGQPTFLNFGRDLTVVIWGRSLAKWGDPPPAKRFADKQVCVTGKITEYKSAPQIAEPESLSPEI